MGSKNIAIKHVDVSTSKPAEFVHADSSRKCNMHEITAPSRTWGFPSNLSCSTTDATTTGGAGAGVLRCKYIYMCPSTQQQQQQQLYRRNIKVTILECRRNGKWFGKLPDCSLGKLVSCCCCWGWLRWRLRFGADFFCGQKFYLSSAEKLFSKFSLLKV